MGEVEEDIFGVERGIIVWEEGVWRDLNARCGDDGVECRERGYTL